MGQDPELLVRTPAGGDSAVAVVMNGSRLDYSGVRGLGPPTEAACWLPARRKPFVAAAVNSMGSRTPSRAISMIRIAKRRVAASSFSFSPSARQAGISALLMISIVSGSKAASPSRNGVIGTAAPPGNRQQSHLPWHESSSAFVGLATPGHKESVKSNGATAWKSERLPEILLVTRLRLPRAGPCPASAGPFPTSGGGPSGGTYAWRSQSRDSPFSCTRRRLVYDPCPLPDKRHAHIRFSHLTKWGHYGFQRGQCLMDMGQDRKFGSGSA